MKKTILFFLLIFIFSCQVEHVKNNDYIRIEHIGDIDKPILVLAIVKTKISDFEGDPYYNMIVVSNEFFDIVADFIEKKEKAIQGSNNFKHKFGTFEIALFNEGNTVKFYLKDINESRLFFTDLIKQVKNLNNKHKVLKSLERTLARLG